MGHAFVNLYRQTYSSYQSISLLTIAGTRSIVESVLPDTSEGIGLDLVDGCGVAINNLYYVYFCLFCCKAFCTLFFFHLHIADSKQEEFQKGKWSDTICYYFMVKFALLWSLDNFCQHCYSELTPTTWW